MPCLLWTVKLISNAPTLTQRLEHLLDEVLTLVFLISYSFYFIIVNRKHRFNLPDVTIEKAVITTNLRSMTLIEKR